MLQPFVGAAGMLLNDVLRQAGLNFDGIPKANVICHQPPGNKIDLFITRNKKLAQKQGLVWSDRTRCYQADFVDSHIDILKDTIRKVNPNVIVALGNTALTVLTGESGIVSWRGSIMESRVLRGNGVYKVVPTFHPAAVLRQYSWIYPMVQDLRRAKGEADSPEITYPRYKFLVEPTYDVVMKQLDEYFAMLTAGPLELSIDIETSRRQTSCIGFAHTDRDALCVPFMDSRKPGGNYWSFDEELAIVRRIKDLLLHPNLRIIGQNYGYDKIYNYRNWGVLPKTAIDTSTYHHTNWALLPKKISAQASMFCRYYKYWKEEGKTKGDKKDWGSRVDPVKLWTYNCKDCVITYEVAQVQKANAEALRRTRPTIKLQTGEFLSPIQFQMAMHEPASLATAIGTRIDKVARKRISQEIETDIAAMQSRLNYIVGHPINARSPQQLMRFFYGDLQHSPVIDRKTNKPTLNEDALHSIAAKRPELRVPIGLILNIRSGTVFNSTFVKADLLHGRFHCTYDIDGTATYRMSSRKDPMQYGSNGQNIPKGHGSLAQEVKKLGGQVTFEALCKHVGAKDPTKLWVKVMHEEHLDLLLVKGTYPEARITYNFSLPNIRSMFIPEPGAMIGDWDLDRADLQVVAWRAAELDPNGPTQELKQALREKVDLHTVHAKMINATRDMAKIFIHLTNYGGSAATASRHCGVTVHTADTMQKRYFAGRPGIKRWHEDVWRQLQTKGEIISKFGYVCRWFDRIDGGTLPKALGWEPQHTVAIVINMGWMNLHRLEPDIHVNLQVHDSLVMQAPICTGEALTNLNDRVRRRMSIEIPFDDPLVIPVSGNWSTKNWADTKGD